MTEIVAKKMPEKKSDDTFFDAMNLRDEILRGIYCYGFDRPSFVQHAGIPTIMEHPSHDVVMYGSVGSGTILSGAQVLIFVGKTAAYLVPILNLLASDYTNRSIRTVIVAPSRELAIQIYKVALALAHFTDIKAKALVGGESVAQNLRDVKENRLCF